MHARKESNQLKKTAESRVKSQGSRVKNQESRVKGQESRVKGQGMKGMISMAKAALERVLAQHGVRRAPQLEERL
jgi:hypothetical protein